MPDAVDLEGLPDAEERRRISERARRSLAEARALLEWLERLDLQAAQITAEGRALSDSGHLSFQGRRE